MSFFLVLAQVALVTSDGMTIASQAASTFDWSHLAWLAAPVVAYLVKALVMRLSGSTQRVRLAKLLVAIMSDASDEHAHGASWAEAVLTKAEAHSDDLLALATAVLPSGLSQVTVGGAGPPSSPPYHPLTPGGASPQTPPLGGAS